MSSPTEKLNLASKLQGLVRNAHQLSFIPRKGGQGTHTAAWLLMPGAALPVRGKNKDNYVDGYTNFICQLDKRVNGRCGNTKDTKTEQLFLQSISIEFFRVARKCGLKDSNRLIRKIKEGTLSTFLLIEDIGYVHDSLIYENETTQAHCIVRISKRKYS